MAWFDGTFASSEEYLCREFPIKVTKTLRFSRNMKRVAIINDYKKGTPMYDAADPKAETDKRGDVLFCNFFCGKDAGKAGRAMMTFVKKGYHKVPENVVLFRRDGDEVFKYSYGHICSGLMLMQKDLNARFAGLSEDDGKMFVLPLKRQFYRCYVCGTRSLQYRPLWEICDECGWEDEILEGYEDEPSDINNGYTMAEYREEYNHLKEMYPGYKWSTHFAQWSEMQDKSPQKARLLAELNGEQ